MKCLKCGTEWTDNENTVNLKNRPFCGNLLSGNAGVKDYSTMADVLKYIVCKYGKNVFNDNYKVINIFKNLAPKLEKESKVFEVATNFIK